MAMLNNQRVYIYILIYNVNPGLINHGLWNNGGIPPIVMIWYLNGTLPMKNSRVGFINPGLTLYSGYD